VENDYKFQETDVNLRKFEEYVQATALSLGMTLVRQLSDSTLIAVKGGRMTLYFSIKPKKMVSVWQINEEIVHRIPTNLSSFSLRQIGLPLNRRITIDLKSFGSEAMDVVKAILFTNRK
jgi:hypothetical protein